MYYELTDHFVVAATVEQAWSFFGRAENLPAITPPWLKFTIRDTGGRPIGPDSILDYTIRWAGVPIRWRTRIIDWTPPRQFIDLQIRGPYALWHHQHTFTPTSAGATDCRDRVIYKLPLGPAGRLVHAAIVRRQLLGIFRFRRKVIGEQLGWVRAVQPDVTIRTVP
jgi:ligand-binding SRPBCC domain-containing protein